MLSFTGSEEIRNSVGRVSQPKGIAKWVESASGRDSVGGVSQKNAVSGIRQLGKTGSRV